MSLSSDLRVQLTEAQIVSLDRRVVRELQAKTKAEHDAKGYRYMGYVCSALIFICAIFLVLSVYHDSDSSVIQTLIIVVMLSSDVVWAYAYSKGLLKGGTCWYLEVSALSSEKSLQNCEFTCIDHWLFVINFPSKAELRKKETERVGGFITIVNRIREHFPDKCLYRYILEKGRSIRMEVYYFGTVEQPDIEDMVPLFILGPE